MPNHSFSPVAAIYDFLSHLVFGRKLQEAQAANLIYVKDNSRILIIGGGSGWILQQVLQTTQNSIIIYLEVSASMLQKARKRNQKISSTNLIEYRLGTEDAIGQEEQFDLIIANFFFDLFSPDYLKGVMLKLCNALAPSGSFLITDFVLPEESTKAKWQFELLFKSMYLFFRLTCGISATSLPDWEKYLRQFSLIEVKSRYFYHHLIKSTVFQKNTG